MTTTMILLQGILIYTLITIGFVDCKLSWIAVRLPLLGYEAEPGAPWPYPQHWMKDSVLRTLHPNNFTFETSVTSCDVLSEAFTRYRSYLFPEPKFEADPDLEAVQGLRVDVIDQRCGSTVFPEYEMDESYNLTVDENAYAHLEAVTVWGALRGLETFSQLVFTTDENKILVNQTFIQDFPRFSYRGFMIDTARHFIPMSIFLKNLDAMAFNKLNVLHWHVVDDQAFPYPLQSFPNFTELGTYSEHHRYSVEDVQTILHEARKRGIRVIPEFDTPGHTYSWGLALPKLITPCWKDGQPFVPVYNLHGAAEVINPMEEYVYDVLREIYTEIVRDFPDHYVHLGMDEAYYSCWKSNPNISQWMLEMNFTSYPQVEEYYANRLINIVRDLQSKYIIWNDPIENGVKVDPDTIVEVWKKDAIEGWEFYARQVTAQGYQMILSAPWYLNYISYGEDWKTYYAVEPTNFTENSTQKALMKGGEVCFWAEYIDGTNFLSRLWPRASAVAERLWSDVNVTDQDAAKFRLDQQRCRMLRRGIPTQPIFPGYCGDYDYGLNPEPVEPTQISLMATEASASSFPNRLTLIFLSLLLIMLN